MKKRSIICACLAALSLGLAAVPLARANVWDEETRLVMIKVLVGEAGYSLVPDHPAIIAVLHKRKELPAWRNKGFVELARAYSAVVREGMPANANRARTALVTRETAPAPIVQLVDAVGDGRLLAPCRRQWQPGMLCDPCQNRAIHWGSAVDAARSPLARISCGRTHNVFLGPRDTTPARPRAVPINGLIPANEAY
jgi:hypothetical protein